MSDTAYIRRRGEIRTYFDRTAVEGWKRLAGNGPLSAIRETVRRGRADMRSALLSVLPDDLAGWRVLDAGCGAGAMSVELARRGADVVGIDVAPSIVDFARQSLPADIGPGSILFAAGDMLSADLGRFDAVVAMDSLIHYEPETALAALEKLAARTERQIVFTFAPWSPALGLMHRVGKFFPRGDKSPAIVPVRPDRIATGLAGRLGGNGWRPGETLRVSSGFYTSQMMEVTRR
ncbi:MAG: magnesium protoporphyrin IX methyltransferase [Rhizobiaceae bacterium]